MTVRAAKFLAATDETAEVLRREWLSAKALGEKRGFSDVTAMAHVRALRARGIVVKERTTRTGFHGPASVQYHVAPEVLDE